MLRSLCDSSKGEANCSCLESLTVRFLVEEKGSILDVVTGEWREFKVSERDAHIYGGVQRKWCDVGAVNLALHQRGN